MKTAISLPDELFARVERTARQLGIARSRLFARAVEEFLRHHDPDQVTRAINAVVNQEDEGLDPVVARIQSISVSGEATDDPW